MLYCTYVLPLSLYFNVQRRFTSIKSLYLFNFFFLVIFSRYYDYKKKNSSFRKWSITPKVYLTNKDTCTHVYICISQAARCSLPLPLSFSLYIYPTKTFHFTIVLLMLLLQSIIRIDRSEMNHLYGIPVFEKGNNDKKKKPRRAKATRLYTFFLDAHTYTYMLPRCQAVVAGSNRWTAHFYLSLSRTRVSVYMCVCACI